MTRRDRFRRWMQTHPVVVDGALATALLALLWTAILTDQGFLSGPRPAYLASAVALTLPLAWRRSRPLLSTVVVMAGLAGEELAVRPSPTLDAALVPLLITMFSVAAHTNGRRAGAGLAVGLLAGLVWVGADDLLLPLVAFGGAWVSGRLVRVGAEQARTARENADALIREGAAELRATIAEERAQIAREVHDVVAHTLGGIVVQAGAERIHAEPGSTTHTAFASIEQSGRAALEQMGRLLGVLRGQPELFPQPGLEAVADLVAGVRATAAPTGRLVGLVVTGVPRPLAQDVSLSAYRIVQEALTNALRHSASSRVEVRLGWEPSLLRIEVRDDGSGPTGAADGHGLVGIRERVALHGGALTTGRSDWGGYLLAATLPTTVLP
jgi:signal transduction histidine kinase